MHNAIVAAMYSATPLPSDDKASIPIFSRTVAAFFLLFVHPGAKSTYKLYDWGHAIAENSPCAFVMQVAICNSFVSAKATELKTIC